jgi:methyl-accepting chemotaxis protein
MMFRAEESMGVEARSVAPRPGAPKRKLRNYLLDRRFQLKYTGMVVGVTMVVASILGALAYHESKGQTEALQIQLATQPDLDPGVSAGLEAFGADRDREILLGIIFGVAALTITLGLTGIVITHKMVGPAYKMRLLLTNVAQGHLRVDGHLRKGDELKEVFNSFNDMVHRLRARREHDLEQLDAALAASQGRPDEVARILGEVKSRMRAELD